MDRERTNQWGEQWCEASWLTSWQADEMARDLNARAGAK
jgi:hypothetical protein